MESRYNRKRLCRTYYAPAIQSTVLPWKNSSYNTDDATAGNNKTFTTAMSKPVKQQEFPPNWIASSAQTGEETKSSSGKVISSVAWNHIM